VDQLVMPERRDMQQKHKKWKIKLNDAYSTS